MSESVSTAQVTVLMPVRNAEAHIAGALASILTQTERDFVLMLVDDGSTDASIDIAESIGDRRIRIVRDGRHLGVATRLNWGLDHVTTPFVARMDADDLAAPERLARQLSFMRAHPDVGICGTWYRSFSADRTAGEETLPTEHAALAAMTVFASPFAHPTVMFNMRLLNQAGLRYSALAAHAEDYDLWERSASRLRFANIPAFLLGYRLHAGQASRQFVAKQKGFSDIVRVRALARRGIRASPDQLVVHLDYCNGRARKLGQRYRAFRWLRWLRKNLLLRDEPEDALIAECRRREATLRAEINAGLLRRVGVKCGQKDRCG